jgi:hypothetical protein
MVTAQQGDTSARIISVSPAHVVNFKEMSDSQAVHPTGPTRTGAIPQIEDKDPNYRPPHHAIPPNTPTYDPNQTDGSKPADKKRSKCHRHHMRKRNDPVTNMK